MIYTSYFARLQHFPSSLFPISIARYPPKWYTGATMDFLAPTHEILQRWKNSNQTPEDEKQYEEAFVKDVLSHLLPLMIFYGATIILPMQNKFSTEQVDAVLLCYERPEKFCHRHIVAKWFREAGIPCEEWRGNIGNNRP